MHETAVLERVSGEKRLMGKGMVASHDERHGDMTQTDALHVFVGLPGAGNRGEKQGAIGLIALQRLDLLEERGARIALDPQGDGGIGGTQASFRIKDVRIKRRVPDDAADTQVALSGKKTLEMLPGEGELLPKLLGVIEKEGSGIGEIDGVAIALE